MHEATDNPGPRRHGSSISWHRSFHFSSFYYQPIVVIDMDEIAGYVQKKGIKMDTDEAVDYIGKYYDWMAKELKQRKELIIVRKAIYNTDKAKDITMNIKDKFLIKKGPDRKNSHCPSSPPNGDDRLPKGKRKGTNSASSMTAA